MIRPYKTERTSTIV